MDMTQEDIEAEQAYLLARNNVSDEELVARMNAAPDMGGQTLVELAAFLERRSKRGEQA